MEIRLFLIGAEDGDYLRVVDWPVVPRVGDSLAFTANDDPASEVDEDSWVFEVVNVQWSTDGFPTVHFEPGPHYRLLTGKLIEKHGYKRQEYDD